MSRNVVIVAALLASLGLGPAASGFSFSEDNWWPGTVRLFDDSAGRPDEVSLLGPIFGYRTDPREEVFSFRPFLTEYWDKERNAMSFHFLYPAFNYYDYGEHAHWHFFNLLRGASWNEGAEGSLQLWPFLFWDDRVKDEEDSFALWPLGGRIRNFFGRDTLDFALWPLYVRTQRKGENGYGTPWPFIQWRTGEASGFALWPLWGHFERPGEYDRTFALWPLYYNHYTDLDQEVPSHHFGILPFYARDTADGLLSETFGWPFFGYTRERDPRPRYDETRYFWPLLVQGRGEERHVNRFLPIYTHERRKEAQKWWYLWPLLKREEIDLGFLTRYRTQFLYFLFRDEHQANEQGFSARKQFLWPFYSYWNDGQGRKQIQALDPITVFFPKDRGARESWTPLFAIFRHDERPDSVRQSWFWNFVVREKGPDRRRFTVGPIVSAERTPDHASWSILHGLIARSHRNGETRWSFFWQSPEETNSP